MLLSLCVQQTACGYSLSRRWDSETHADLRKLQKCCWRSVEWSCRYNEARACVKLGFPLDVADGAGNTPLMLACREGHGRLVKLFARKGADVAAYNVEGMTAEQLALSKGHTGIVKFLHESKNASLSES